MKKFLAIFLTMLFLFAHTTAFADVGEHTNDNEDGELEEENLETATCCSALAGSSENVISLCNIEDILVANQENTVQFSVQTTQEVLEIYCESDGLNVVSYNYSNDSIYVKFTDNEDEIASNLTVAALLEDETVLTANMYGYCFENNLFISGASADDAFEKYCLYSLNSGLINENEYKTILNKYYKQSVIITTSTEPAMSTMLAPGTAEIQAKSKTTYLNGVVVWVDDNSVQHRCQNVRVDVYDKEVGNPKLIATTYTNSNGIYSVTFENNSSIFELGGYDIYIEVFAGGPYGYVKKANGDKYSISTVDEVIQNVENGSTSQINLKFVMNDVANIGGDLGRAFQISQPISVASRYAEEMNGSAMSEVSVIYPANRTDCVYRNGYNTIEITGSAKNEHSNVNSYASWDVIMHEYGHHVQYVIGNISSNTTGVHYINTNMADHYHRDILNGELCSSCVRNNVANLESISSCREKALKLSWKEAWATVFGFLAQQYYIDELYNIGFIGDAEYNAYNISVAETYNLETFVDSVSGESNETAIISVLYNLYDSNTNTFDNISLGHETFWSATLGSTPAVLSDFINYIVDNDIVNEDSLAVMLDYYQINSKQKTVTNCSLSTRPSFYWEPRGGSVYYLNNAFHLVFYNQNGVEVYKTGQITAWSYTLTQDEWDFIIENCGNKFMWAIESYQTDNIVTGPYRSVKSNIINIPS